LLFLVGEDLRPEGGQEEWSWANQSCCCRFGALREGEFGGTAYGNPLVVAADSIDGLTTNQMICFLYKSDAERIHGIGSSDSNLGPGISHWQWLHVILATLLSWSGRRREARAAVQHTMGIEPRAGSGCRFVWCSAGHPVPGLDVDESSECSPLWPYALLDGCRCQEPVPPNTDYCFRRLVRVLWRHECTKESIVSFSHVSRCNTMLTTHSCPARMPTCQAPRVHRRLHASSVVLTSLSPCHPAPFMSCHSSIHGCG
jgi:hypothetical protein